jgi:hypothetical protein
MVGAASATAQPDDGPRMRVRSYDLAGKATLILSVPSEWKQEIRNATTGSPTIVFTPPAGSSFQLLITPIPNVNAPVLADPDKLRTLVKEDGWTLLARSVEKGVNPVELKGKAASGYSYTLTAKSPKKGGFPLITAGTLLAADYLVHFSLAHRDSDASLTAPLEALQSLEIKPAPSSTAEAEPTVRVNSGR